MTPLNSDELRHLLNFIGYGNLDADVWWLGMEEGMARDDSPEANLRARLKFEPVEDLRDACVRNGLTKHHEGNRVSQATWWPMCEVMLHVSGRQVDRESKRAYQAERLGRHSGETLLLELMPIPKPDFGSWGYEELIPQFHSRDDYYGQVMPERVAMIRGLIHKHRPRLVIGYGKAYWEHYQKLFPGLDFHAPADAERFLIGCAETTAVLTPHMTSRQMNGQVSKLATLAEGVLIGQQG
jgi:hypothetical protein